MYEVSFFLINSFDSSVCSSCSRLSHLLYQKHIFSFHSSLFQYFIILFCPFSLCFSFTLLFPSTFFLLLYITHPAILPSLWLLSSKTLMSKLPWHRKIKISSVKTFTVLSVGQYSEGLMGKGDKGCIQLNILKIHKDSAYICLWLI